MAEIKYLNLERLSQYDSKIKEVISSGDAKSIKSFEVKDDTVYMFKSETVPKKADGSIDTDSSSFVGSFALAGSQVAALQTKVGDATLTTTAQDLSAAVNELDAALDTANTQIGDLDASIDAIVDVDTGLLKQAKDYTDTKVGTLTNLSTTAKDNVVVAINECFAAIGTGGTASVVSVAAKENANESYLKTYVISQGGNSVGEIDIPKDLVVTSGSVIVVDDDNPVASLTNGTYLKLTIANQEAPVYIDVAKMCDVYTAEAGATQVQLAISATNEVSATIVAGSITATELGADAVETAKIKDGAVTEGKLDTELATKIGKIATNETAIGTLNANASTEGSVDYKIAQAIGGLDTYVAITEDEINALFTATP